MTVKIYCNKNPTSEFPTLGQYDGASVTYSRRLMPLSIFLAFMQVVGSAHQNFFEKASQYSCDASMSLADNLSICVKSTGWNIVVLVYEGAEKRSDFTFSKSCVDVFLRNLYPKAVEFKKKIEQCQYKQMSVPVRQTFDSTDLLPEEHKVSMTPSS